MYPPTKLVDGDELPDGDTVSRYCKPSTYDLKLGEPKVGAFQLSENERQDDCPALSVNRLQYFPPQSVASAVDCVRQEFKDYCFKTRRNGRFIAFNVEDTKKAVSHHRNYQLVFRYTPDPPMCSHSLMYGMPKDRNEERVVATAIKRHITTLHTAKAVI